MFNSNKIMNKEGRCQCNNETEDNCYEKPKFDHAGSMMTENPQKPK